MVASAIRRGAEEVIVGLGGSATSDAGIGLVQALNDAFPTWKNGRGEVLKKVRFIIATDVNNPLCGVNGAARVFSPQKGATAEMVEQIEERTRRFAEASAREMGFSQNCDGISTKSRWTLVPERDEYLHLDSRLWSACPNSCTNVSTSEKVSSDGLVGVGRVKFMVSVTRGRTSFPDESTYCSRKLVIHAPLCLVARGKKSVYSTPKKESS